MSSHVNRYLRKRDVDPACLKNLCHALNIKKAQVRIDRKTTRVVPLSDIIDESIGDWAAGAYDMYREILERYERDGPKGDYRDTALWALEEYNAPRGQEHVVKERVSKFLQLYESIKKHGFERRSNNLVKLLTLDGREPCREVRGLRFSRRYFRLTGLKRCVVCKYLGIKKVPCRIFISRIHPL